MIAACDGSSQPFYGVTKTAYAVSFGGSSPLNRVELCPSDNIYIAELYGIDLALKTAIINDIYRLELHIDNASALNIALALQAADHEATVLQIASKHPVASVLIQRIAALTKKFKNLILLKIESHTINTSIPHLLNSDADALAVNILRTTFSQVPAFFPLPYHPLPPTPPNAASTCSCPLCLGSALLSNLSQSGASRRPPLKASTHATTPHTNAPTRN